jgi:HK97 family phage major capsid protein
MQPRNDGRPYAGDPVSALRRMGLAVFGDDAREGGAATALLEKAKARADEVRPIIERAKAEKREFTDAERTLVKSAVDAVDELKAKAQEANADEGLVTALSTFESGFAKGLPEGGAPAGSSSKTLGERALEGGIGDYLKGITPSGGPVPDHVGIKSPAVQFGGIKDIFGRKDIISGSEDNRGGALLVPDFRGLLDVNFARRPLVIRDLVTQGSTTGDAISYARVLSETNNAAPVPEATGTSGGEETYDVAGTKPESDAEWEQVLDTVKTIAHWMPVTRRALSDVAQMRSYIDGFLRFGLDEELEDQILAGNGVGENFEGILNVDGTQSQGPVDDIFVTIRKAKTKARITGRGRNIVTVVNPEDNERIDLERDNENRFYGNGPFGTGPDTIWGMRRIESEAIDPGTAIVGDFSWATLWDREAAAIMVSDSHSNFFVRNLIAVLAELRAGFGVIRPAAFVITELPAGS